MSGVEVDRTRTPSAKTRRMTRHTYRLHNVTDMGAGVTLIAGNLDWRYNTLRLPHSPPLQALPSHQSLL
jgi:hypothetical protein